MQSGPRIGDSDRSHRSRCLVIAILFAAGTQMPALAAGPSRADALAAIAAYAPQALEQQGAPGMSVVVTDASGTMQTLTLGYANVDAKLPVTPETRFPIGSITKSMTALALMQLVDAGTLNLDAPVVDYLPDFKIESAGKPIVVHQLLSHTAGVPTNFAVSSGYLDDVYDLKNAAVLFSPGSSFSYSNDGFATAGAILAHLDEKPWIASVQERVLDPLGMPSTSPEFTPENMIDAAVGYTIRDFDRPVANRPALVASPPLDFVDPAGSVIATPEDMAAYMRFYLRGGTAADGRRLLSTAAFARMINPDRNGERLAGAEKPEMAEAPDFYRRYGMGLSISSDHGDRMIEHTGGISGYTSCMEMNLTLGFGVTAMSNLVEAPLHPCAIVRYAVRVLRAQSLGEPLPMPPAATDVAAIARAGDYAGTFTPPGGSAITFARSGSGLSLIDGAQTFGVFRRDDDMFWTDDPRFARFLLYFHRNAAHAVTDMTWGASEFAGTRYHATTAAYPAAYDALVGRYDTEYWMQQNEARVVIVHGKLTFEGMQPLVDENDGTFLSGTDVVRFDHVFDGRPQRMFVGAQEYDRVELP